VVLKELTRLVLTGMYTPANSLDEQQNEDSNKATLIQVDK